MGRVSVVMAVYNGRPFLEEQVRSLLADLHPDDEVIVVDDASSDDSADWIRSLDDARIVLLRNASNRGVLGTFEAALARVAHEIVFLCDQDDIWLPGKRDLFVEQFDNDPAVVVVVCDAQVIDESGRVVTESFMAGRGGFHGSLAATLWKNRYLGCAMALRRSILRTALPIPAKAPMHDMWLGAIASVLGRAAYLDVPLVQYRRHPGNYSRHRRASLPRMLVWRWRLLTAVAARLLRVLGERPFARPPARRRTREAGLTAAHRPKRLLD